MVDERNDVPLQHLDSHRHAANFLSIGQILLWDNPLLNRPPTLADVKLMLFGHWGTTPGQSFTYAHLNHVIKAYELNMMPISGPGHVGAAIVANTYLEGTGTEVYPDIDREDAGVKRLFRQISFPGVIPCNASHAWSATARPRPGAGHRLAFEQASRPGHRQCGAVDPAPPCSTHALLPPVRDECPAAVELRR